MKHENHIQQKSTSAAKQQGSLLTGSIHKTIIRNIGNIIFGISSVNHKFLPPVKMSDSKKRIFHTRLYSIYTQNILNLYSIYTQNILKLYPIYTRVPIICRSAAVDVPFTRYSFYPDTIFFLPVYIFFFSSNPGAQHLGRPPPKMLYKQKPPTTNRRF